MLRPLSLEKSEAEIFQDLATSSLTIKHAPSEDFGTILAACSLQTMTQYFYSNFKLLSKIRMVPNVNKTKLSSLPMLNQIRFVAFKIGEVAWAPGAGQTSLILVLSTDDLDRFPSQINPIERIFQCIQRAMSSDRRASVCLLLEQCRVWLASIAQSCLIHPSLRPG